MDSHVKQITQDYLQPKLGPSDIAEPVTYHSLYILDTISNVLNASTSQGTAEVQSNLALPCDPFNEMLPVTQTDLAFGVLLAHRQAWEQQGLALGNLIHSVCLAPGEVTQVAVVDWTRRTVGTESQQVDQGESVTSDIDQSRAVNEIQRAVAEEAQAGNSMTSSTATSSQAGISGGGLLFGGSASTSASHSSGMSAQFSAGKRNLAAESNNELSQRTAEKSQALRSRRSSVVKEVSESESETMTTRVLANYNHRHSLNIEYFEVLQTYSIKTKLASWERCIFLPMKLVDFDDAMIVEQHLDELIAIFSRYAELAPKVKELKAIVDAPPEDKLKKQRLAQDLKNALTDYTTTRKERDDWELFEQTIALVVKIAATVEDPASFRTAIEPYMLALGSIKSELIEPHASSVMHLASGKRDAFVSLLNTLKDETGSNASASRLQVVEIQKKIDDCRIKLAAYRIPVQDLLKTHELFFSQQLWMQMDAYRVYRMLQNIKIDDSPLSAMVDPNPVGVFGNYVAFRWGFRADAASQKSESVFVNQTKFKEQYVSDGNVDIDGEDEPPQIALPTSGVFCEAVLGRSEASETIDESKFWRWTEEPIPILPPKINALTSRDRAKGMDLDPSDFAAAIAALRSQNPADISHIGAALSAIQKNDMFRNMSGLKEAAELAGQMAKISGEGATAAGERSAQVYGKILDTFTEVLESDAGQAMVAEFMLPGSGEVLKAGKELGAIAEGETPKKSDSKASKKTKPSKLTTDTPSAKDMVDKKG